MTRATDHPVRRVVSGQTHGALVVEVTTEELRVRPFGRRKAVTIPWGAVYLRAVQAVVEAERRERRKGKHRVKRGVKV